MKTGTLEKKITSGFSILILFFVLIASFSGEASAKRGCSAFGHSCYGGHGKRSNVDDEIRVKEIGTDSTRTNDVERSIENDAAVNFNKNEIRQLRDFMKCPDCVVELSRLSRNDPNYFPLFLRQLLSSNRRPYSIDSTLNEK